MEVCLDNSLIKQDKHRVPGSLEIPKEMPSQHGHKQNVMGSCSLSVSLFLFLSFQTAKRIPFGNRQTSHHSQIRLMLSEAASEEAIQCRQPASRNAFL